MGNESTKYLKQIKSYMEAENKTNYIQHDEFQSCSNKH